MTEHDVNQPAGSGLGERLHTLAEHVAVPGAGLDDVTLAVRRRTSARRVRIAGVACLVGAGVVFGGLAVTNRNDRSDRVTTAAPEPTASSVAGTDTVPTTATPIAESLPTTTLAPSEPEPSPDGDGVTLIPEPPMEFRWGAATVAFKATVMVWGGQIPTDDGPDALPLADGAIWGPDEQWHPMPTSPLPGGPASGVFVGGVGYLLENKGMFAVYDPSSESWRQIEAPPDPLSASARLAIVNGQSPLIVPDGWLWSATDESWRRVAPAPTDSEFTRTVSVGSDLYLVVEENGATQGWRYDVAADAWNDLPAPFEGRWAAGDVAGELVAAAERGSGTAVFDVVSQMWRLLPPRPVLGGGCSAPAVGGAGATIVVPTCEGSLLILQPGDEQWWPVTLPGSDPYDRGFADWSGAPLQFVDSFGPRLVMHGSFITAQLSTWEPPPGDVLVLGTYIVDELGPGSLEVVDIGADGVVHGVRMQLTAVNCTIDWSDQLLLADGVPRTASSRSCADGSEFPSWGVYQLHEKAVRDRRDVLADAVSSFVAPPASESVYPVSYEVSQALQEVLAPFVEADAMALLPGSTSFGGGWLGGDDQPTVYFDWNFTVPGDTWSYLSYRVVVSQRSDGTFVLDSATLEQDCRWGVDPNDSSTCRTGPS